MPEFGNNLLALVDLNVWLALVYDGHVHHPVAISWFEHGGRESAAFCRITFAISAQVSFVTFDRGFNRFAQLRVTLLGSPTN
jgi:predicted nucleic acid-binding protein